MHAGEINGGVFKMYLNFTSKTDITTIQARASKYMNISK